MQEWRNWQTRRLQVPVVARSCGFKSHLLHYFFLPKTGVLLKRSSYSIYKTPDLKTASEFRSTMAIISLLKSWIKSAKTRLTLKQCTFESITQPENNLSASINSCRDFLIRSFYIQNYIFVLILWTRIALRADGCVSLATLSKIKSGEKAQEKNSSGIL